MAHRSVNFVGVSLRTIAWLGVLAVLLISIGSCGMAGKAEPADHVTTDGGALRGARVDGVFAFRGIPYAAPPVGEQRWRPPQPVVPWSGVRSAIDYAPSCAQPVSAIFQLPSGGNGTATSEDCLTLNVWSPNTRPATPLPVMVWIHGGGFSQGSGNLAGLNGTALPLQGVVVVTVNYRLAMFGFLAHPELARPGDPVGNYGLLDAAAALGWVQRNIAAFGGDPRRVTLFGESAGADAVNYLMVMPAARGLFQQAISQSSSVGLAPAPRFGRAEGFNPPAERIAEAYFAKLGPAAFDGPDRAAALRALSAEQLLAAMGERDRFSPVIDGETLPDQVGLLFAAGRQHRVPYLTGGNSWEASLGRTIGGGFSPAFAARLVPAADRERFYPGLAGDRLDDAIFGDLIILSPSRYLASRMRASGAPVHVYYLSYVAEAKRDRQPGVAHADDIPFVMGTLQQGTDRDWTVSRLMSNYWIRFAQTGDPNGPGLPDWPAWAADSDPVLEIGDEVAVRQGLFADRLSYHVGRGIARLEDVR
ncbi:MAG: carboxylesterase family protein [Gammaproteobacteria bacterium]